MFYRQLKECFAMYFYRKKEWKFPSGEKKNISEAFSEDSIYFAK